MNGYKAFYKGQSIEIYAESIYKAQLKAAETFSVPPKKTYLIAVVLCEKDGQQITHIAAE